MNRRALRAALVVLACLASAGAIALAVAGLTFAAAGAYALPPLAILAYGRVRAGDGGGGHGPGPGAPGTSAQVAVSPKDMTPEERWNAAFWGRMGIEGQIHSAGLVVPPIVTAGMTLAVLGGGYYLGAALTAATGLFLTRMGWVAGLKFDPVAPKVPDLRSLEAGRPWVDVVVLVLAASALFWLARVSLAADAVAEASVIAVMGVLSAAALVLPVRTLWRRRRLKRSAACPP